MNQVPGRDMRADEIASFATSPNPVILEVGCNDGTDTNILLQYLPAATVYCFEPDPRAIARQKQTVNNPHVTLIEAAASNVDSTALFHGSSGRPPNRGPNASHYCRLPEWDLSGSLCKPTGHLKMSPWTTFPEDRHFQVRTLRLDTWLAGHSEIDLIDFIWTDVQGAEGLLIQGATEVLNHTVWFYTEYYSTPMYEGQPNLEAIQEMLPRFDLHTCYGTTNALFKNRELECCKSQS